MIRNSLFFKIASLFLLYSLLPSLSPAQAEVFLSGAGATFPYPLYQKWIDTFQNQTDVRISYAAIGSGKGIKRLLDRVVDFGGTDIFLSNEEARHHPDEILHIPSCVGAVTVIYHLPGNPDLRLTPDLIADIFTGEITLWSDRRIAKVNPDISMPTLNITVVHRSEESGTTFIFTDYLAKTNSKWSDEFGRGKTVKWPAGIGVEGNPGVSDYVRKIPGSVGYVELTYAKNNNLPTASIRNRAGHFILPTLDSVSAAATVELPLDTKVLLTDSSHPGAYPISTFTYIIVYKEQSYKGRSSDKARSLARFLWWITHEGQQQCSPLLYAPLSQEARIRAEVIIRAMAFNGEPVGIW